MAGLGPGGCAQGPERKAGRSGGETWKGVRGVKMIDAEKLKDVLENVKNHLEAYPNVLASYKECVMALIDVVNAQPAVTPPPNDPLTLEELREMDGEPVWVLSLGGRSEPCWMLVDVEYELCREAHGGLAIFDTYEKTWLAYRRRPEEGTE